MPARRRGLFVCFEGIDQSGKKTQVHALLKSLENRGITIVQLSFPDYSTPVGKEIQLSLAGEGVDQPRVRHMLFAANRWERTAEIEDAIRLGKLLVANRYSASNYAFGGARGLPVSWLRNLEKSLPQPDLTVLLDIPPEISLARKSARRDLHERDLEYLSDVRKIYLRLARSRDWKIVNGNRSIKEVHEEVLGIVEKLLKRRSLLN